MTGASSVIGATDLRNAVETAVGGGDFSYAMHLAETLWLLAPSLSTAGFLKSALAPAVRGLNLPCKKIDIFRSYTVEPLVPLIEVMGLFNRYVLEVRAGQYNAFIQDLIAGPADGDAVVISLHTRTAAPTLWTGGTDSEMRRDAAWLEDNLSAALETYRTRSTAPIALQLLDYPPHSPDDHRKQRIDEVNAHLEEMARRISDCHTFHTMDLTQCAGDRWFDERNWAFAKMPFRNEFSSGVAARIFQNVRPALGASIKVLVVDLDNTLWGGVLGEDGESSLQMAPGSGFRRLQGVLSRLKQRGVLLAIASKNDEASTRSVLVSHPECELRPSDFVTMRINWDAKSQNIRSMAEELGLGLEAFAFLDDNPVERIEVARGVPSVRVLPHVPDAAVVADMIDVHPEFIRIKITDEDVKRTALYAGRRERHDAESKAVSRETFLSSLQQEVCLETLTDSVFERLAELERKTNQFNLRTRRFTETELRRFANDAMSFILAFRVKDRFGDNGVVGLAVTRIETGVATIENFLMSCRVIGRDVENEMLGYVAAEATLRKATSLKGTFAATQKNAPAADFYRKAGFVFEQSRDGVEYWSGDIQTLIGDKK